MIIINKSIYKTINMHNFEKTKTYLGSTVWFWAGNGPSDPAPVETSCFRFRKYKLCHIVFLLRSHVHFHYISEADDISTPKISQTVPHTRHRTAACSKRHRLSYLLRSVLSVDLLISRNFSSTISATRQSSTFSRATGHIWSSICPVTERKSHKSAMKI